MKKYNQMIYHQGNCLNRKKTYPRECRLCITACPHDAISDQKDITLEKCTECGLCMAVCPSDGFVDRDMRNLGAYIMESDACILNCPMAQPGGYEIACLGMLDADAWKALVLLADHKEVRIVIGDCTSCHDLKASENSRNRYEEIISQWPDHSGISIDTVPDGEGTERDNSQQAKRLMAKRAKNGVKNSVREFSREKIRSVFPAIEADEAYPIPKTREWLIDTLRLHPDKKIPFRAITADSNCNSCGVCARICPQQALELRQSGNKTLLVYEPNKCVQCGRCVDICGSRVLRLENRQLTLKYLLGKILLCEANSYYCSQCGKKIFTDTESGMCAACTVKSTKEPL